MSENIYSTPKSETPSDKNTVQRSIFARIIFSILWLLPTIFVVQIFVGMIVGAGAGMGVSGYEAGKAAGEAAATQFFSTYGIYVLSGELILWLILCILGIFPGTAKFKRSKS